MRNSHCRTWIVTRKLKNVENEKQTLQEVKYVEKHWKTSKMGNAHCRTSKMDIKLENERNQKLTEQDLEYGEKH